MPNLTSVGLTAGVPTTGTGTVSTIDALMADGGQATLGAKADAKNTATDTTAISAVSIWKQISASVQAAATSVAGTLTVGTHAVTGSGNFASTVADGADVTLGAKGDAKSTATDTTAISGISIWKQISASIQAVATALGSAVFDRNTGATGAATLRVTVANDQLGTLGQAAMAGCVPVTIASDQSNAFSAAVTLTRTADTNVYAANDVVGASVGASAALTFASMGPSAGRVVITSCSLEIDAAAVISGETSYLLYLYNVTPPSASVDNAAWDLPSGDRASFLGFINLGTPVDLGSTLYVQTDNINKQVKLSGTSIFGYLVTVGTYTPTSARVHVVTLHTVAV